MNIPTIDELAREIWRNIAAAAVLSLLASKSETPETAKYPLKATKEMLDAAEISWTRSYEYEPYRFEKMLNAALAAVAIPLAESEQRGDRCAQRGAFGITCNEPRRSPRHDRTRNGTHDFVEPVSPMPPLGDAAGSEDADLKAAQEGQCGYPTPNESPGICLLPAYVHRRGYNLDPGHDFVPRVRCKCHKYTIPLGMIGARGEDGDHTPTDCPSEPSSEQPDLKVLIAQANALIRTTHNITESDTMIERLADALEARESPLPSPAEPEELEDAILAAAGWTEVAWRVAAIRRLLHRYAFLAGPAPSVEPTCPDCHGTKDKPERDYIENGGVYCPHEFHRPATVAPSPVDVERCVFGREKHDLYPCDVHGGVLHADSYAEVRREERAPVCTLRPPGNRGPSQPSPVDTMVSAADVFEKMRAARDAYAEETSAGRIGRAIVAFMDAVIASHPACEDRKAK